MSWEPRLEVVAPFLSILGMPTLHSVGFAWPSRVSGGDYAMNCLMVQTLAEDADRS